jgi:hypothetical protein
MGASGGAAYGQYFGQKTQEIALSASGATPGPKTINNEPDITEFLNNLNVGTVVYVDGMYYVNARVQYPHNEIALVGSIPYGSGFGFTNPTGTDDNIAGDYVLLGNVNGGQGSNPNAGTGYEGDYYTPRVVSITMTSTTTFTCASILASDVGQLIQVSGEVGGEALHITPGTLIQSVTAGVGGVLAIPAIVNSGTFNVIIGDYYPGAMPGTGDAGPASASTTSICQFYAPTNDVNNSLYIHMFHLRLDLNGAQFGPDGVTPVTARQLVHIQERSRLEDVTVAQPGSAGYTNTPGTFSPYAFVLLGNNTAHSSGRYNDEKNLSYGNGLFQTLSLHDGSNGNTLFGVVGDVDFWEYSTGAGGTSAGRSYNASCVVYNMIDSCVSRGVGGHHEGCPRNSGTDMAMIMLRDCADMKLHQDLHIGNSNINNPGIRATTSANLPQAGWGTGGNYGTVGTSYATTEPDFGGVHVKNNGGSFVNNFYEFQPYGAGSPTVVIPGSPCPLRFSQADALGKRYTDQTGAKHNAVPRQRQIFPAHIDGGPAGSGLPAANAVSATSATATLADINASLSYVGQIIQIIRADTGASVVAAGTTILNSVSFPTIPGTQYGLSNAPTYTGKVYAIVGGGNWLCPVGITALTIESFGAGGSSAGAGNGNAAQVGSSGGAAGLWTRQDFTVTEGHTYQIVPGVPDIPGTGGQVTGPNPGTAVSNTGTATTVTDITTSTLICTNAKGNPGILSAGNSTTAVGGGMYAADSDSTVAAQGPWAGCGNGPVSTSAHSGPPLGPVVGGSCGGNGSAGTGGATGQAQQAGTPLQRQLQPAAGTGGSGATGANATPATQMGCGASGAGGGAANSAVGGNGAMGAPGGAILDW